MNETKKNMDCVFAFNRWNRHKLVTRFCYATKPELWREAKNLKLIEFRI